MRKPPLWASVFSLAAIVLLCALGFWQVFRMEWKTNLIQNLEAAYVNKRPVSLTHEALAGKDFVFGRIEGRFLPDKALLLGLRMKDEKAGRDLIVPVITNNGGVLVNMGWTTGTLATLPIHHLQGKTVWFEGLARSPTWSAFTPQNQPEQNLWFRPDIAQIAAAKKIENPAPFILYAERASHTFDAAFPNNETPVIRNNHLQYALFWFAMAAAAGGVYFVRFIRTARG